MMPAVGDITWDDFWLLCNLESYPPPFVQTAPPHSLERTVSRENAGSGRIRTWLEAGTALRLGKTVQNRFGLGCDLGCRRHPHRFISGEPGKFSDEGAGATPSSLGAFFFGLKWEGDLIGVGIYRVKDHSPACRPTQRKRDREREREREGGEAERQKERVRD